MSWRWRREFPHYETDTLLEAGETLRREHDLQYVAVTMSEKGMRVLSDEGSYFSRARAREVFDVSGAGDTVIATLAAGMAGGLQMETAVELANLAAGIVVGKVGTVPIAHHELIAALTPSSGLTMGEKILDRERLMVRVQEWRAAGRDDRVHQWLLRPAACRACDAAGGLPQVRLEAAAGFELGCERAEVEGADAADCRRAGTIARDGGAGGGGCGGAV